MNWWQGLVLGLVQGASEFLPISSSGHLLLLEKLGVGEENLFFNIMLHVGTLLAVLIVMRKQWWPLLRRPKQKKTGLLLLACVPTVLIALAFKFCFPELLEGELLATGFMLSAVLLIAAENLVFAKPALNNSKISILTGVFQGIAVLPGVSRSGSTIACMRLCGVEKHEAASFSFLLSIPIILGSALYETASLIKDSIGANGVPFITQVAAETCVGGVGILPLLLGVAAAFISGFLAMKLFFKILNRNSLTAFGVYDALIAVVTLVLLGLKII